MRELLREDERLLLGLTKTALDSGVEFTSVSSAFLMELLTRLYEARECLLSHCRDKHDCCSRQERRQAVTSTFQ